MYFLLNIHDIFLVEWKDIDYNFGNYFDGTIFTAPQTGLYSFLAQFNRWGHYSKESDVYAYLFVNGTDIAISYTRSYADNDIIPFVLQTTLKLAKGDKVEVRPEGKVYKADDRQWTYFEGRFISRIDE